MGKKKRKMNIKVNKKKEVKVILNRLFYDLESINESIKDFNDICDVKVKKGKNPENILISLKLKTKLDPRTVGYEFRNYVLGLMKNKTLV